jgi:hypothetical protein
VNQQSIFLAKADQLSPNLVATYRVLAQLWSLSLTYGNSQPSEVFCFHQAGSVSPRRVFEYECENEDEYDVV